MLKKSFLSSEYLVSDEGFVLNKQQTKKLKPSINPKGYQMVNLMINGKRIGVAVHILVARAFCDGYKEGLTVNHIDGNKRNNKASNLEWITNQENQHHYLYQLGGLQKKSGQNNCNSKTIHMIDKTTNQIIKTFPSIIDAAKYINPQATYTELRHIQNCIVRVAKGTRKSYKNFLWKY